MVGEGELITEALSEVEANRRRGQRTIECNDYGHIPRASRNDCPCRKEAFFPRRACKVEGVAGESYCWRESRICIVQSEKE
jgi:hypothetical protein